jgi:hypothetical protein
MQSPLKQASRNTTTTNQLFKKQHLPLNPTFTPELHTNNTNTHSIINDEDVDDDNVFCLKIMLIHLGHQNMTMLFPLWDPLF